MLVTVGGSGGFMPDTIVMMVHTLMPAMIAISNTTRPIMISMRLVVLGLRSDFRLSRVAMRMAPGVLKSDVAVTLAPAIGTRRKRMALSAGRMKGTRFDGTR